jgi:hypothetical protein
MFALIAVVIVAGVAAIAFVVIGGGDSEPAVYEDATYSEQSSAESSDTTSNVPTNGDVSTTETVATPAPTPSGPSVGDWIVQLESVSTSAGQGSLDRLLAENRAVVPEAQVLLSDDFASMKPGFWVVYAPGPFSTGMDAISFCDAYGLGMPDDCLGRLLTSSSADVQSSQCYRARSGALTPGCSR